LESIIFRMIVITTFPFDAEHPFRASTLSRHLDITPGIEVSACSKIPEASSSANHPSNTSLRIGELSCCIPRSKIQRQSESAEGIKRSILPGHQSQVHPVENYLPQQQKWGAPPVYPLQLHENYQQPQQCFNKPNGPCGPWYASLTPAHGGHNYQPLWPPSKYQLTSSTAFKPQEAPQTCLNNYHGYTQQRSAPNPFAYGAHTGYGNYQEQWSIGASWQQPPPWVQRQATP